LTDEPQAHQIVVRQANEEGRPFRSAATCNSFNDYGSYR
jgi:hypothetical protein